MSLIELLQQFRVNFYSTHVMVYDDCMVYSIHAGDVQREIDKANNLIQQLNLPLTATLTSKTTYTICQKK